jgi:excisionase family DNA binding protein
MHEKELMRPADLAPALGVGVRRIYQLISTGEIPAIRVGGSLRIPRLAWQSWLWERSEAALNPAGERPAENAGAIKSVAAEEV